MSHTDYDRIWVNARIATFNPRVPAPYGMLDGHVLAVRGERVAAVLPADAPEVKDHLGLVADCRGKLITPGLIDCHTHLVWGGSRADEWEMRLAGVPYTEIARRGGGILSTVRDTRGTGEELLLAAALPRLQALVAEGVTCVEIKSGYGLTLEDELKLLRVAKRLGERLNVEVSATLLAAHAVPPEFAGRADDYVAHIVADMIPAVAAEKLAEAVDVFCESIGFTPAQCDRIFTAAKEHGLAVKGHVEQLSNSRGAELVARHGGWSADHLEHLDGAGVAALAKAGVVAVLLPGAYYFLREPMAPPCMSLLASRVPMAIGSDLNPGTSPFASLRLAMNMACVLYGLSPEEALTGVTRSAAKALGRSARLGTLEPGKRADFLVWDVKHPAEIVCQLGVNPIVERVVRGSSYAKPRDESQDAAGADTPPGAETIAVRSPDGPPPAPDTGPPSDPVRELVPADGGPPSDGTSIKWVGLAAEPVRVPVPPPAPDALPDLDDASPASTGPPSIVPLAPGAPEGGPPSDGTSIKWAALTGTSSDVLGLPRPAPKAGPDSGSGDELPFAEPYDGPPSDRSAGAFAAPKGAPANASEAVPTPPPASDDASPPPPAEAEDPSSPDGNPPPSGTAIKWTNLT
jgi:imidazolonepropionase